MEQYNVTGMSCAACSARVEKAVNKVPGVTSCCVSLLTNSMGVEGTAAPQDIIAAVIDAGYGASLKENVDIPGHVTANAKNRVTSGRQNKGSLEDTQTPLIRKRLFASVGFLIVLMYFSMGHMMWGWPLPSWFDGNHVAIGLVQMILAVIIMLINQKFFISGFKSLIKGAPNMDTLVALGSLASFLWSVYALFAMTDAVVKGNHELVMTYMDEFYFESTAMILTLITVGKMLESHSKGKTTDALKQLLNLMPKTANVIRDNEEISLPIEQVRVGDVFVVRPGENIPLDGVIIEGSGPVNEAALTGESIPVDKSEGSFVSAATINQTGFLKCEATRVGEDTTLSQIIKMVSDAAATKAPIAKAADKVSGVFVPAVIAIAVVTFVIWMFCGADFSFALARAISVLVISCPCALGLATPVAIMVGNGVGAKNGILFKTAVSLEETGKTQIVVLDKTGTITSGEPKVTDILTAENVSEKDLLLTAYALEKKSEHPLAKAVVGKVRELGLSKEENENQISEFQVLAGNGLMAVIGTETVIGGSLKYIESKVTVPQSMKKEADKFSENGKTPLLFAKGDKLMGIIAVADVIKEDSPHAVEELKRMGIEVIMLTGDNEKTALAIGKQVGVDKVIAGVLPDGKEEEIRKLKEFGKVAMVGDGINDAPALTRADMGIAIGAGTDVAIDAADVVLMKSRLSDVPAAIRLSRATLKNIHENLFWAFIYNVIGIPLAAGCYIAAFGWKLNPMFGAAAMSLSSFCVVSNALRLNLVKLHKKSGMSEENIEAEEKKTESESTEKSKKIFHAGIIYIHIEGMMCHHCENAVKKVLEALPQVSQADADYEKGIAKVIIESDISYEDLKKVIEAEDYQVIGIDG